MQQRIDVLERVASCCEVCGTPISADTSLCDDCVDAAWSAKIAADERTFNEAERADQDHFI